MWNRKLSFEDLWKVRDPGVSLYEGGGGSSWRRDGVSVISGHPGKRKLESTAGTMYIRVDFLFQ
jgi:hypothetical protein